MNRALKLLRDIEADALDSNADLARTLRRVIALGGEANSGHLREWATRELKGYDRESDIPPYRQVAAPLVVDGVSGNFHVTGRAISPFSLPKVAHGKVTEELALGQPLSVLTHALGGKGESIRLQPPRGSDLVLLMNAEQTDPYTYIEPLYHEVSKATVAMVIDAIRTTLVELVSEIRAGLGPDFDGEVSSEIAEQALNIAVSGDANRISFGAIGIARERGHARVTSRGRGQSGQRWAWAAGIGTLLVGVAAVAVVVTDLI